MATSRTGTAKWKRVVQAVRYRDRHLVNCPVCGVWLDWERSRRPNSPEVDHILPHSRGGTDTVGNARIICRRCNQRLGAKTGKHEPPKVVTVDLDEMDRW